MFIKKMLLPYSILILMFTIGFIICSYVLYLFFKRVRLPYTEAVIMEVHWSDRTSSFECKYKIIDKIVKGPVNVSLNPLGSVFSHISVGDKVRVKYDECRNRILPNVITLLFYFFIGSFFAGLGFYMLYAITILN